MELENNPFSIHAKEYDAWFDEHPLIFLSELTAIASLIPEQAKCLELGVGTGRFAELLRIKHGVEPSEEMGEYAKQRGIQVVQGVAEELPFPEHAFDAILLITVLCFLESPAKAMEEIRRVLKPNGCLILAFMDRDSPLGKQYNKKKANHPYYNKARFFSTIEVYTLLDIYGFTVEETVQTLFGDGELNTMSSVQNYTLGHGEGGFVVVKAVVH